MGHRRAITNPETRRTTLKEVAHLAGVSVSTASLVLSGRAGERRISGEVEQRVRHIAAEQGYLPNLLVQSLQRGRTHILSFFNAFRSRSLDDLYMDRVSSAIEIAAAECGYDLLVHRAGGRTDDEVFRLVGGGFSDGLLFFGPPENSGLLDRLRASRVPTVLFNHADPVGGLPFVCDDWRGGMHQIADHLAALGHRYIAAMDGFPGSDGFARIAALREGLAVHGIDLPASRVVASYRESYDPEQALDLLLTGPEPPPTALFCWHDRLGYDVLEVCERCGIRIPEELSIVSYDGLHWPSTSPHLLASVQVPVADAAVRAVTLLDALVTGQTVPATEQWYPVHLIPGTTLTHPPHSSQQQDHV